MTDPEAPADEEATEFVVSPEEKAREATRRDEPLPPPGAVISPEDWAGH